MDERSDMDRADEVMLPGFRFHPTDEELVGFYLKRKIQQKPLSIELIRQLDIYKYDPWDLPKLATTGEKEWYFYCPRDRKYRNSARPNRVTRAGFWKATGTDRPIYSSEGTKCIGLKKSLVFYKGRAAKGVKTDWMMHEFRLPSLTDSSLPKRPLDKNIHPNDSWAVCRIFKKTNSMAQRALSHSWVSPTPTENTELDMYSVSLQSNHFGSENISCTTDTTSAFQFGCGNGLQHQLATAVTYPSLDVTTFKPTNLIISKPSPLNVSSADMPTSFMFSPTDISVPSKGSVDVASMLLNLSPHIFGDADKASTSLDFGQPQQCNGFTVGLPLEINGSYMNGEEDASVNKMINISNGNSSNQWGTVKSFSFPFNMPTKVSDDWKPMLAWDSLPCPSEMSATYSSNKCYT